MPEDTIILKICWLVILMKNKALERFQGLSDAAEKSANRATKTPHVEIYLYYYILFP